MNRTDKSRRAVFLDRDGTINIEKDYLFRPEDLEFIPGAPEAIARLNRAGFLVIVVTNQSGVARGYFGIEEVDRLHKYMQQQLSAFGATIDAFYICPHHPDTGLDSFRVDCDCRKEKPGMLLQAAADWGIDLTGSFMVGDKDSDLLAGTAAGCRAFLVETGYGARYTGFADEHNFAVGKNLDSVVDKILDLSR